MWGVWSERSSLQKREMLLTITLTDVERESGRRLSSEGKEDEKNAESKES